MCNCSIKKVLVISIIKWPALALGNRQFCISRVIKSDHLRYTREAHNRRFPRPNAEEGKGVFDISKKIISHQSELKMAGISPGESPIFASHE